MEARIEIRNFLARSVDSMVWFMEIGQCQFVSLIDRLIGMERLPEIEPDRGRRREIRQ